MKKIFILIAFLISFSSYAEEPNSSFNFSSVSVSQAVDQIYSQILKVDYVLDPEVLNDQRILSFKYSADNKVQPRSFVARWLSSLGYSVSTKDGADFISKNRVIESANEPKKIPFIYKPHYRDSVQLAKMLAPLFKYGTFTQNRSISSQTIQTPAINSGIQSISKAVPDGSATSLIDQTSDFLVFNGPLAEIAMLKQVLPQVDVPYGMVSIQSALIETTTDKIEGSAIALVASLLNSKLGLTFNSSTIGSTNSAQLSLNIGGFNSVLNVLDSDSRLKTVTSPTLRIKSGSSGTLSYGQSVPTLGAISTTAVSQVQSVVYQNAGLILMLAPVVHETTIDLKIEQQISSFATTTTGVNNSPTLTKREVKTDVVASDGEIILLGGLNQSNDSAISTGLPGLPSMLNARSSSKSNTELILVLQVQKVKS